MDADLFVNILFADTESFPQLCQPGLLGAAFPFLFEERTFRPAVAELIICDLGPQLENNVEVVVHELLHALVLLPSCPATLAPLKFGKL